MILKLKFRITVVLNCLRNTLSSLFPFGVMYSPKFKKKLRFENCFYDTEKILDHKRNSVFLVVAIFFQLQVSENST